ncbi:MAG TPA: sigma-70 family RNA polymerase sigma factor [Blastocatellia bacterium]|nr:sigma-70 family RNA polymerase sigma factor [Blastocatellia bacterium]
MSTLDQATCVNDLVTDEELVCRILAGQGDVFAQLYERYHVRAYRLAWSMTAQREAAEDLTQEIFLRAYQKLAQFRGEASFATWFYRLAVNCCLHHRQRARRHWAETMEETELIRLLDEQSAPRTQAIEASVLQHEQQALIHQALLGLKPELRMVVILRNLEELSYDEIAARMNCSLGTVGTWLHRAHKLLATKLVGLQKL